MQLTKTLDDVRDSVQEDDSGKWDSIARVQEICLHQGRLVFPQAQQDGYDTGLCLSSWALAQACTRLGLPAAYFRKCPPPLQDANFNYWVQSAHIGREFTRDDRDPEESWLVRSKGTTVRGVLSPRYAKLDNRQLLDALMPVLSGTRYKVGLVKLTGESFHLRLVDPTIARDVLPGDKLMVGIHLANSEVGLRAVTVDALVYRLICTNGLIRRINSKSLLRQRHLYVHEPRFQQMLESAIGEAVTVAAGFIEQMALAIRTPVHHPEVAIALLGKLWNLPKATIELVRTNLSGESGATGPTLYGLTNALTFAAQRMGIEDRFALETLAGALVDTTSASLADRQLRERVLTAKSLPMETTGLAEPADSITVTQNGSGQPHSTGLYVPLSTPSGPTSEKLGQTILALT